MTETINLNRARKARAASDAKAKAAQNRVRFGRTKAETSLAKLRTEQSRRALDQARRDDD